MMIAEESTSWPRVSHPVDHGGLGFTHKWNMGWMHDTLGYFAHDPVHRRWHHRDLTFGLLYAFSERFVLPLSATTRSCTARGRCSTRCRATSGSASPTCARCTAGCGPTPATRCCSWAARSRSGPSGTRTHGRRLGSRSTGERHRGVQELVRALNRVAGDVAGALGARPRADRLPVARRRRRRPLDVRLPALVGRRPRGGGLHRQLHAGAAGGLPRRPAVGGRVAGAARHQRHVLRRHRLRRDPRRCGPPTTSRTRASRRRPSSPLPPLAVVWLGSRAT